MVEGSGGCEDWRFGVGKDGRWQRGLRGFWGVALAVSMACSRDKTNCVMVTLHSYMYFYYKNTL